MNVDPALRKKRSPGLATMAYARSLYRMLGLVCVTPPQQLIGGDSGMQLQRNQYSGLTHVRHGAKSGAAFNVNGSRLVKGSRPAQSGQRYRQTWSRRLPFDDS